MGTHFTVDVTVGSPPQTFSVVADTGSNHLIVPSCICMDNGICDKRDRCFRGTNHSSSFAIQDMDSKLGPPAMLITFGSGQVQAVIATDVARVAGIEAAMNGSLLLMVDQALNMQGAFEGILGLGLPQKPQNLTLEAEHERSESSTEGSGDEMRKIIDQIIAGMAGGEGGIVSGNGTLQTAQEIPELAPAVLQEQIQKASFAARRTGIKPLTAHPDAQNMTNGSSTNAPALLIAEPKGFLELAGVTRFSMCFKEAGNGTLQLGTPKVEDQLDSNGHYHWSLDFRGITLGKDSVSVPICSRENMTKDQESACAVIPDSGTTAIMAPKEQLAVLYDHICDNWERCHANHSAFEEAKKAGSAAAKAKYGFDVFGIDKVKMGKGEILQFVLQDCGKWLTESNGLDDEMPVLSFQVAGKSGKVTNLDLTGWAYVLEQEQEVGEPIYKEFLGEKIAVGINKTGRTEKLCSLAFSEMEYNTKLNGPVWILGTPLFYAFKVAYDMDPDAPAISFTSTQDSPCEACETSLLDSGVKDQRHAIKSSRRPRQITGQWRVPNLDLSLPL